MNTKIATNTLHCKTLACLAFSAILFTPTLQAQAKTNYTIDSARSQLKWMGSKVSGKHNGQIHLKKGRVRVQGSSFQGSFVVDMSSITCTDISNPKYNKKLVDHLKSRDFFHTSKHKTAKLVILQARPQKKPAQKDKNYIVERDYLVKAKVTIRGITRKVTFTARVQLPQAGAKKGKFRAKGTLKLDRTLFNVKYNSGKFFKALGDKLIHDTFRIQFDIVS